MLHFMCEHIQCETSSKLFQDGQPLSLVDLALQYPLTCIGKITLPIFLQKHQESLILSDDGCRMSMDAVWRRKQLPTPP